MRPRSNVLLALVLAGCGGGSDGVPLSGFEALLGTWQANDYLVVNAENPSSPMPFQVTEVVTATIAQDSSFGLSTTAPFNLGPINVVGNVLSVNDTTFLVEASVNSGPLDTLTVTYLRSGNQLAVSAAGLTFNVDFDPELEPILIEAILNRTSASSTLGTPLEP